MMMNSDKYPISHISRIRMGTDGNGIRTLILLSGCPLRCRYCLNPDTWNGNRAPDMMTAEELYQKVSIDRLYMLATGGGVTFGGGEPLEYPDLISEFRQICDPGITIFAETSFNVDQSHIEKVIDSVDVFLIDIKSTDPDIYRSYTGGELEVVINNLKYVLEHKSSDNVIVRIPLIDGYNTIDSQRDSKQLLRSMGIKRFDLFSYITE